MPFCPQCRHEFESHAADCPDCEVVLVEELVEGGAEPQFRLMLLLGADEEVLDLLEQTLGRARIPVCRLDPERLQSDSLEAGLMVPQELFRQAVSLLDGDTRLLRTSVVVNVKDDQGEPQEQALVCYRLFDRTESGAGEIRAPELLQQPTQVLVSRGAEIVNDLLEFIRRGDETTRQKALSVMCGMGSESLEALARMLAVLAREGREAAVFAVVKMIQARLSDPAQLTDLIAVALDAGLDPVHRALALHALGRCELTGVYEPILALLDDPYLIIREEADETLCALSDEDMGFDPDLPPEERAVIREHWRIWFLEHRGP